MPIVDLMLVMPAGAAPAPGLAQRAADALAQALGQPPGRVWVRLHTLPATHYAENHAALADDELPAFATVLHARAPADAAAEAALITQALAAALGRPADRVHVEYAPPGAGRLAFGGVLVR